MSGHGKRYNEARASIDRERLYQPSEAIGILKRKRAEQGGVGQREHRAVGPDAQGERHSRRHREARPGSQLADCVTNIRPKFIEALSQSHLTIPLSTEVHTSSFQSVHVAEPCHRQRASDALIHTSLDQFACAHLHVESDLLINFPIERHTPQPRPK